MKEKNDLKDFNLVDLARLLINEKKIIILVTGIFIVASVVYSLVADEVYELSCGIKPAELSKEISLSKAMGLGVSITNKKKPPVVRDILLSAHSKDFLKIFYEKYKNDTVFFDDLLTDINKDYRDDPYLEQRKFNVAMKFFKEELLTVYDEDLSTITFVFHHQNRELAYDFLIDYLKKLKKYIQTKNVEILNQDIKYYQSLIANIYDPTVKTQLSKKLADKIYQNKILSTNIFHIVQNPYIPHKRVFPKRKFIVIIATILGFFLSLLVVVSKHFYIYLRDELKEA